MQSVSSRIWTRVVVSISYDDNHYTTCTNQTVFSLSLCQSYSFHSSTRFLSFFIFVFVFLPSKPFSLLSASLPLSTHNLFPSISLPFFFSLFSSLFLLFLSVFVSTSLSLKKWLLWLPAVNVQTSEMCVSVFVYSLYFLLRVTNKLLAVWINCWVFIIEQF